MTDLRPSVVGLTLERDTDNDRLEDVEDLARERGRLGLPPREPCLDRDSCEQLGIDDRAGRELIAVVCRALADLLCAGKTVEVLGFGTFRVKPYRPARPARIGDHSFVEAPYMGPIEFGASALLQRQLDTGQLEASLVARCDALYAALREDPRMPRGKIPQLIRAVFRALTAVLLTHNIVELADVGVLVLRPRPNQLRIDAETRDVRTFTGFRSVLLRPSPALIERLPGQIVLAEPQPLPPPPPLLHVDREDEPEE